MNKKKKLKSLKYYINDKEELINQVFSCIPEKQIKKMVPVTLKDMSCDELKAECLVQLLTMSTNKIISILEGRKCTGENVYTDSKENKKINRKRTSKSTTNHSINKKRKCEKDLELAESNTAEQHNNDSSSKGTRLGSRKKHKEKKYKEKARNKTSEAEEKNDPYSKEKNLLELLELEMRAKAIRSLLKQEEEDEDLDKQSEQSENIKIENEIKQKAKNKEILKVTIQAESKYLSEITTIDSNRRSNYLEVSSEAKQMEAPTSLELESSSQSALDNTERLKDKYDWNEEERLLYEDDDSDEKTEIDKYKEKEKSEDNSRNSWAERWLQSKDVKRVVATSKMLAAVRNKMKNNLKTTNTIKPTVSNPKFQMPEIIGTVKEYDTLEQLEAAVTEDAKT